MRRSAAFGFALLFLTATVVVAVAPTAGAAAASGGHRIQVDATFHGAGAFVTQCSGVTQTSEGRFHDRLVGRGAYSFHMCVALFDDPITFSGGFTLSTPGAVLNGTISGTDTGSGIVLPITITGGTGRFSRSRGSLTLGPLHEYDFTNCVPPSNVLCMNWKDSGPITGTITRVG